MKHNKILLLLAATFILSQRVANAQYDKIVPVSPEAAALAKMVNYPVSYNTGIPDINIPLYQVKTGNLVLPIVLNYHAGGFRANEQATRVGLGWSLSTDIQITRQVNGLDDLDPTVGYMSHTYSLITGGVPYPTADGVGIALGEKDGMPDKFNYKLLNKSGSFFFLKNSSGITTSIIPVPFDNIKIQYDNGRFIITDTDGTIYYFGETGAGDILTRGVEISGSPDIFGNCPDCIVTSWKCKKIMSAETNDEISFNYVKKAVTRIKQTSDRIEYVSNPGQCSRPGYKTSNTYPLDSYTTVEGFSGLISMDDVSTPRYTEFFAGSTTAKLHVPYVDGSNNVIDKVYTSTVENSSGSGVAGLSLTEIHFRGGKVVFTGTEALTYIHIYDDQDQVIKYFQFVQSYANANYIPESQYYNGASFPGTRYLDELKIMNGGTTFESYVLTYQSKFCFGTHLKGHDAWGYVNGSTSEIAMAGNSAMQIPLTKRIEPRYYFASGCVSYVDNVPLTFGGDLWAESANRNEEYSQRGMLKRIVYPTGGSVDFDFESNQFEERYDDPLSVTYLPQQSGGLRIRSITTYEGGSPSMSSQKYFKYGDKENGLGILINKPKLALTSNSFHYEPVSYEQNYVTVYAPNTSCYSVSCLAVSNVEKKTIYQLASSMDYTYASGAPIYYTTVSEYQQDFGEQTGKILHEYYPPAEFLDSYNPFLHGNRIPGTNIEYIQVDGLSSAKKCETVFKINSKKEYKPVHKKSYTYIPYIFPTRISVTFAFLKNIIRPEGSVALGFSNLELYGHANNFYYNGAFLENDFQGGAYDLPAGRLLMNEETETFYDENNEHSIARSYGYANLPDIQPSMISTINSKNEQIIELKKYPFNFPGNAVYDAMVAKNRVSAVVEVETRNHTYDKELSRKTTTYGYQNEGTGFYAPSFTQSSLNGHSPETDLTIDKYDQHGNILQITSKDGISTSYLWGYNGLYPVAELKGIEYASIPTSYINNMQITSPASDIALNAQLTSLRSSLSGSGLVTSFTYKRQVGMTSQTDANGISTYYNYDAIGRLSQTLDADLNIQKQLKYNMVGPSTPATNIYLSAGSNVPIMRTHSVECSPNIWQSYNYTVAGGTVVAGSVADANDFAKYSAEHPYLVPVLPPCPVENTTATIALLGLYNGLESIPQKVEIDFIQNGAVVATKEIHGITSIGVPDPYEYMHLPEGEYIINIRPSGTNFKSSTIYYDFTDTDIGFINHVFRSGLVVQLSRNKQYEIVVTNVNAFPQGVYPM